jgi:peptidoglycan/LPS O-acetylase OafA/YrhL
MGNRGVHNAGPPECPGQAGVGELPAAAAIRYPGVMSPSPGHEPQRTAPQTPGGDDAGRSLGLDLLRALAILLVMVSHWANNVGFWFHVQAPPVVFVSGDVGVELFFALSGFLIGRILIGIAATGPTWRNFAIFMARRAMRTLPLYFLWLAVLLWFLPPRQDALAVALRFATLTQNLIAPMPPDHYFGVSWSLTIEEWFYLLFGGAVICGARLLGGSRALWLCLAVFLAGPLALRVAELRWSELGLELYKEVFFRIDEIGYGVLMARLYLGRSWLFRHPWPPLALGLLLVGLAWAGRLPVPISLMLALTFNAMAIGCALCLPAALRLRHAAAWFAVPVRWLAARSYALYIVHLTILVHVVQARLWEPGILSSPVAAVLAIGSPFLLAELSYRCLERPILRLRPRQELPRSPLPSGVAMRLRAAAPAP